MSPGRTNLLIAVCTLLFLCTCFVVRDTIPAASGTGYDGGRYAAWAKTLGIDALIDSAATRWQPSPPGAERPLDTYYARRILPSLVVHYLLAGTGVESSTANVILAFTVLNIALLVVTVVCWLKAADELHVGRNGKWIAVIGLVVSYGNLKMPLYYPTLTDTSALAAGAAAMLFYVQRRTVALWLMAFAGGFIWPTFTYFGCLLLAFPRTDSGLDVPARRGVAVAFALGIAIGVVVAIELLFRTGYELRNTPVHPIARLRNVSAIVVGVYLFFGARALLDSRALWESLQPRVLVTSSRFLMAVLLLVSTEAVVRVVAPLPPEITLREALSNYAISAVFQPFTFFVAHVLYFGPVVIFALFAWPEIAARVRQLGPGAIAYVLAALLMSIGSESRQLINALPFVFLVLAPSLEHVVSSWPRATAFAAVTFLCSKAWLPMDRTLSLPYLGAVDWRAFYVSSRGPWIEHGVYLGQLLVLTPVAVMFYRWWKSARTLPAAVPAEVGLDRRTTQPAVG
ncbi:MAG TPA: hypothetical protein VGJ52_10085 [Vicinamibacterales bacterium]